ncbi:MAG: class I SAM-dependent methyltransferase [Myxococcaceae bacterium]
MTESISLANQDFKTVESFGAEWEKFCNFSREEIEHSGQLYFDLIDETMLNKNTVALDVGCGSGRWDKYIAHRVKFIEAIDPSSAVFVAERFFQEEGIKNIRVTRAGVEQIPFPDNSFDFVFSLGVLHHVPRTEDGIRRCVEKLKPGGWFLVYLYYNLDNRSYVHGFLLKLVTFFRKGISNLPKPIKEAVCELIAATIYWPLASLSRLLSTDVIPLSAYRNASFKVMRNDALDRFGTPLEQRFSRIQIQAMLERAGLSNIRFSEKVPYWHAVAQKV